MTDVEELLRETLTDARHKLEPGPGLYETVRSRADQRRHRQLAIAAASVAVVVVAGVGSVVGLHGSKQHRATPANVPGPSSAPVQGSLGSAIDLGANSGQVIAAVATANALYVLTANPNEVVALDPTGKHVLATAAGPPGTPSGIVVDEDTRVWAWSQDTGDVRQYDAATLSPVGTEFTNAVHVPNVFNAAVIDGALWLTSEQGLFQWPTLAKGLAPQPTKIASLDGFVYGLAPDPSRHRVLVGVTPAESASPSTNGFAGARVVAIDTRTGKVVAQSAPTALGKESIAVVGDQVWVGGYGDVDKPRLLHLDAKTLKVVGTSPIGAKVGPGSMVWPGQSVVWARGGGDEQLGCLDPETGAVLQTWNAVQGPVTSVRGSAFGVESGLQQLNLAGRCAG
jgi:hypothetical protein